MHVKVKFDSLLLTVLNLLPLLVSVKSFLCECVKGAFVLNADGLSVHLVCQKKLERKKC
jgi:hypothetical protein